MCTVVNASKIVVPGSPKYWLGCRKQSVGFSLFVLIRARILYSVFCKVICLYSAGVVEMSFLGMHTTMPCFCCSMIRTSKNIRLNVARMSPLMLFQLTLKISIQMPSLSGALLQATLLTTAFSPSSVMGVPRKSLHSSGKFLCPAFLH